jgi:hypothetical protein
MQTITGQQLKTKLATGQDIKLVMTVGGWTFRSRHIPGSLGFPSPCCALRELRHDDEIILYSTGQHRQDVVAAFEALTAIATSAAMSAAWLTGRPLATRWRVTASTRPPPIAGPTGTAPRGESWRVAARIVTTAGRATAGHQQEPPIANAETSGGPRPVEWWK